MTLITKEKLVKLQKNVNSIRNICILAHVDHGKTTLADSLVASNGIISQRMAGQLRYMDSRPDEQERGITMKSSCISLLFNDFRGSKDDFIVNLIDSPGHVDFSSEVSTAVRLCDGAIVLVDVVEGVCPQTRICLKQAYIENLKPILVLNKIDRLILEKKFTPLDAYVHISQVLEQVNATMGNIFASDVLLKEVKTSNTDHVSALEDCDDSSIYFTPESGNVIFSSAIDGWAFRVRDFAELYASKLNIPVDKLEQVLWGDYYYNTKKQECSKGAQEKAKKPMFVQFVLENIWSLYEMIAVRKDKEKISSIAEKLGVKVTTRDLRSTDPKVHIQTIFSQWLPVERTLLEMVVRMCPHPGKITDEKATQLMCSLNQNFEALPAQTQALKSEFMNSNAESKTVIAFISKMIPVDKSILPENKPKPLTREQIERRRDFARQRLQQRNEELEAKLAGVSLDETNSNDSKQEEEPGENKEKPEELAKVEENNIFIAFARVYSGTLKKGSKIYAMTPKHDPSSIIDLANATESPYVKEVTVENLYLLMGKELEELEEAPAGNIVGIKGLQDHVLKTATLSSNPFCSSFCDLTIMATPIYRVAVEPKSIADLPKLKKGLKLLNQADACVQVIVQENGEHVLVTLGEIHLERCIYDLEREYAKCPVNVSLPIVPLRETIVPQAKIDMVNEEIVLTAEEKKANKSVTVQTANQRLKMLVIPLPKAVTDLLETSYELLKSATHVTDLSDRSKIRLKEFRQQITSAFKENNEQHEVFQRNDLIDRIWAFGPKKCGTNLLVNLTDFKHQNVWSGFEGANKENAGAERDPRCDFENSLLNGYQLATLSGPLCEEPMHGVCFLIEEWAVKTDESSLSIGSVAGQLISIIKDACREAFQNQPQRLVTPMYSCSIVVSNEVLGKMYAVIGRRHGKILSADLMHGSGTFMVRAVLPVIESYNFAQEIRKQTSGLAYPQLMFSHWETIDIDPYWIPSTEEEYLHFGDKYDAQNRAKLYMDSVRKRKGLFVEEHVVENAEKQRTLTKNK